MTRLLRLTFLALVLAFAGDAPAFAQNQPVSTRPFKGPPFTAFTAETPGNTETCNTTILDVRAYGSLFVRITDSGSVSVSTVVGVGGRYARLCIIDSDTSGSSGYVVFRTYISESGTAPWVLLYEQNGQWQPNMQVDAITVVVTPLPDSLIVGSVGGLAGTSIEADFIAPVLVGGASISGASTVQPDAVGSDISTHGLFTRSPAVRSASCGTSPQASVSNATATKTATITGATTTVATTLDATIQNIGTVALYCKTAATNDGTPPTISTSDLHFILAAGSVANDGTGGSATITGLSNGYSVYCLAASGTGSAAFFCR